MKKSSIYLLIALVVLASCKKNNLTETEHNPTAALTKKTNPPKANRLLSTSKINYGGIDIDYARDCTPWGPGVCFRLPWWEVPFTAGSMDHMIAYDAASDGNSGHGLIAFSVEGNRMRLSFFRDLEESSFRLETNERIEGPLAEFFGYNAITLHAGDYALDRSTLQYGEAIVNATFE